MLKKNKDYLEMRVSSTDCAFTQNEATQISIDGCVYTTYMDIPNPGELYVFISKEKFEKLQARADSNAELAKEWEKNYNLLLNKTGFDTVEELVFYLTNVVQCDTLQEAIASLQDKLKYTCDKWNDMKKKLEECEKDYISERDKAEAVQTENEQLKQKLHEFDPIPEFKELLKKLNSTEDVEELKWVLNHTCGGRGSVNGWIAVSLFWKQNCEAFSKLVGFSSVEEIQDYLTNEAECDTLHEAISKLHDQVKYTCDEWHNANSSNNSWKAAAECNSPKELIEKLNLLRDDISGRSTVIESYKRDIEKWQKATGYLRPEDISTDSMISKSMANEITAANENLWRENEKCEKRIEALLSEIREWRETTGCPSPSSAKTLIESGASWHHAFNEAKEKNRKLIKEVDSWEHVTGFSSPEDYEGGWQKIRRLCETIYKSNDNGEREQEWQDATGPISPEAAKQYIDRLKGRLNKIHGYSFDW